ncbi:hypothetical protein PMIN06_000095 [Paraphaeosphaeria minitans]|uniref:Uncharacterized protein n=1 Tax=Paraphaeosphaeria minitans TaxID=565426 RepID=A0A9P6G5F5_9PLEO|nr:hypothetical protein PMIN01_12882 [Paraphaeosphaeria minitans]
MTQGAIVNIHFAPVLSFEHLYIFWTSTDVSLRIRVDKVNWNKATSVQLGGRPRSTNLHRRKVVVEAALCLALLGVWSRTEQPLLVKEEDHMQCLLPRLARSLSFFRSVSCGGSQGSRVG